MSNSAAARSAALTAEFAAALMSAAAVNSVLEIAAAGLQSWSALRNRRSLYRLRGRPQYRRGSGVRKSLRP